MEEIQASVRLESCNVSMWMFVGLELFVTVVLCLCKQFEPGVSALIVWGALLETIILCMTVLQICRVSAARDIARLALQLKFSKEQSLLKDSHDSSKSGNESKLERSNIQCNVSLSC